MEEVVVVGAVVALIETMMTGRIKEIHIEEMRMAKTNLMDLEVRLIGAAVVAAEEVEVVVEMGIALVTKKIMNVTTKTVRRPKKNHEKFTFQKKMITKKRCSNLV